MHFQIAQTSKRKRLRPVQTYPKKSLGDRSVWNWIVASGIAKSRVDFYIGSMKLLSPSRVSSKQRRRSWCAVKTFTLWPLLASSTAASTISLSAPPAETSFLLFLVSFCSELVGPQMLIPMQSREGERLKRGSQPAESNYKLLSQEALNLQDWIECYTFQSFGMSAILIVAGKVLTRCHHWRRILKVQSLLREEQKH